MVTDKPAGVHGLHISDLGGGSDGNINPLQNVRIWILNGDHRLHDGSHSQKARHKVGKGGDIIIFHRASRRVNSRHIQHPPTHRIATAR